MPDLSFQVEAVQTDPHAAAPLINFQIRIENRATHLSIHNVMLQCQIRIEATRRRYDAAEQARLVELFGEPERWSRSLQGLLWTHASVLVPRFDRACLAVLPVPCSFDFNVGATKYFYGLEVGEVPLLLLFSGAVFYDAGDGLQIEQIAWNQEVRYRLPVAVWQAMMTQYYPDSAWLRLPRGVFDRLCRFKQQQGLATWEHALERLLEAGAKVAA